MKTIIPDNRGSEVINLSRVSNGSYNKIGIECIGARKGFVAKCGNFYLTVWIPGNHELPDCGKSFGSLKDLLDEFLTDSYILRQFDTFEECFEWLK